MFYGDRLLAISTSNAPKGVSSNLSCRDQVNSNSPPKYLIEQSMIKTSAHSKNFNVLFVCTGNIQRSLTAEHICMQWYPHIHFRSAGVSRRECERNRRTLCSIELLRWADQVFVFENMHRERITEHTGQQFTHKIINLDIEDRYKYKEPELVSLLQTKLAEYLET